jgi:HEAT repeat protein
MRFFYPVIFLVCLILTAKNAMSQELQARADSLVNLLKKAGREWNDYSRPLIDIGEPAVPALVEVVSDQSLNQWHRRIAAMTLNSIHSPRWINPALNILFDRKEDPVLRNQVTAGLKGFDLSHVKDDLWKVYEEADSEFHRLNIAHLLLTADTLMAYRSFFEIYRRNEGYVKKTALTNLVILRPEESTFWYLDAIQLDDWMTANMAMDSLVSFTYFEADELVSLYNDPGTGEEVKWRIVFVFGHRDDPGSIPLLIRALQDDSWLVYTEAAVCLSRLDPERVLPAMQALKNDPVTHIRNNSRCVIRNIKDQ